MKQMKLAEETVESDEGAITSDKEEKKCIVC